MSSVTLGLIGTGFLIFLFMLKMPVAFAMIFVGAVGFAVLTSPEAALSLLAQNIFDSFTLYSLSVIPMFILMGTFAYASGISRRLYDTTYTWVGEFRGGLTIATVIACAGFAAICGSTAATAATMGKIALPEMKKYGYDDKLATGTVAAAGTLGILIPPSTILIIYGILVEESIGKLFIAGILPGLLLCLAYIATVVFICKRNPESGPAGVKTSWKEKIYSSRGIFEAVILFSLAIGGLFLGWFSPTQAGAIGAGGALLMGLVRRKISWNGFIDASKEGLKTSCMVMFIVYGAVTFGHFMAVSTIPFAMGEWVEQLPIPPTAIIGVIIFIYFIGGFFMDSMALIVVTIPIFFPIVLKLGYDPIWFGVIIVLIAEMAVITPPVGINLFVIKGIAPDVPLGTIYRGTIPFVVALIVVTFLIVIFPQIATFLPNLVTI